MKLNQDQIEALRRLGGWAEELAYKVFIGEKVTVEREVKRWEPKGGALEKWNNSRHAWVTARLLAYREEFAPGYVVPEIGFGAAFPTFNGSQWAPGSHHCYRSLTEVYMPLDVVKDLCRKLNSGEVVL